MSNEVSPIYFFYYRKSEYSYHEKGFSDKVFSLDPPMIIPKYLDNPKKLVDDYLSQQSQQTPLFGSVSEKFYEFILVNINPLAFNKFLTNPSHLN